jgi:flagellar protein FlaJ
MRRILITLCLSSAVALPLILMNFLFFKNFESLFNLINVFCALIFIFPSLIVWYLDYRRLREMEDNFVAFLRDLTESIRGGMTVLTALKHVSRGEYGVLTKPIRKMASQLDWGIPFDTVLTKFGEETKSPLVKRSIASLIESHSYGGNLTDIMEAIANSVVDIKRLRMERRVFMQSQITTGYIIFFVFLAVMVGIKKFLVPSLTSFGGGMMGLIPGTTAITSPLPEKELVKEFGNVLSHLIIIQAIFTGLMIGKMSEGRMIGGVKHSMIFLAIGLVFLLFIG